MPVQQPTALQAGEGTPRFMRRNNWSEAQEWKSGQYAAIQIESLSFSMPLFLPMLLHSTEECIKLQHHFKNTVEGILPFHLKH